MDNLKLPDEIRGKWTNAVFLTYSADILFFERAIRSLLGNSCNNIIILADGNKWLESVETFEQGIWPRGLNRTYLVNGVFSTTFHPKLILLTNSKEGRLFVGSGNLTLPGYASCGEMFLRFDYSMDQKQDLREFLVAKEFIQSLITLESKGEQIQYQLTNLVKTTPWIQLQAVSSKGIIRFNTSESMISQIQEELSNENIESIDVISPFYDKHLIGLNALYKNFSPNKMRIYLQEGLTSIWQEALEAFVNKHPNSVELYKIETNEKGTYIHNKLYLFKTKRKSFCFQGSANLSQAGFTLVPPYGNYEVMSFLKAGKDEFDDLLHELAISSKINRLEELDFYFEESKEVELEEKANEIRLYNAELCGELLTLHHSNHSIDHDQYALCVGSEEFTIEQVIDKEPRKFSLKINKEEFQALSRENLIRLKQKQQAVYTNFIAITYIDQLKDHIDAPETTQHKDNFGSFEFDDKELEELLFELDESLIVDQDELRSLWYSTQETTNANWNDNEAPHIKYEDIDYEAIKRHPKYQQYYTQSTSDGGSNQPLGIILNSITSHFTYLRECHIGMKVDQSRQDLIFDELQDEEDSIVASEEEAEALEEERQRKTVAQQRRVAKILKRSFKKYIDGITNPKFYTVVGPEIIANNYTIFSHVLWHILNLEWMDTEFVYDTTKTLFSFIWNTDGYYLQLTQNQQEIFLEILKRNQAFSYIFSFGHAFSEYVSQFRERHSELRAVLSHLYRNFCSEYLALVPKTDIENAKNIILDANPMVRISQMDIQEKLIQTCQYQDQKTFFMNLEVQLGLPKNILSLQQSKVTITRGDRQTEIDTQPLLLRMDSSQVNFLLCQKILVQWQKYSETSYIRLTSTDGDMICIFDFKFNKGLYWNDSTGEDEDFSTLPPAQPEQWQINIKKYFSVL